MTSFGRSRRGAASARVVASFAVFVRALCAAILSISAAHAQDAPIPPLTARVTDNAGLLTPDQRATLDSTLADYEAKKGTQIAVLTVASTAPEAIEQYGIRVADAWKIGRKGTADGVILIVAKDNPPDLRRLRIEVGRGVEGAVPDASAKRIIDEDIAPRFREGDFYGGLVAGVDRVEGLLAGEALPPPVARAPQRSVGNGGGSPIWFLLLFFVVPFVIRMFGARRVGYAGGARALNGSFGSFVTGAVLGGLASRGGGFGNGGGGLSGGGGFSGGGGDFGGGGASGDW